MSEGELSGGNSPFPATLKTVRRVEWDAKYRSFAVELWTCCAIEMTISMFHDSLQTGRRQDFVWAGLS